MTKLFSSMIRWVKRGGDRNKRQTQEENALVEEKLKFTEQTVDEIWRERSGLEKSLLLLEIDKAEWEKEKVELVESRDLAVKRLLSAEEKCSVLEIDQARQNVQCDQLVVALQGREADVLRLTEQISTSHSIEKVREKERVELVESRELADKKLLSAEAKCAELQLDLASARAEMDRMIQDQGRRDIQREQLTVALQSREAVIIRLTAQLSTSHNVGKLREKERVMLVESRDMADKKLSAAEAKCAKLEIELESARTEMDLVIQDQRRRDIQRKQLAVALQDREADVIKLTEQVSMSHNVGKLWEKERVMLVESRDMADKKLSAAEAKCAKLEIELESARTEMDLVIQDQRRRDIQRKQLAVALQGREADVIKLTEQVRYDWDMRDQLSTKLAESDREYGQLSTRLAESDSERGQLSTLLAESERERAKLSTLLSCSEDRYRRFALDRAQLKAQVDHWTELARQAVERSVLLKDSLVQSKAARERAERRARFLADQLELVEQRSRLLEDRISEQAARGQGGAGPAGLVERRVMITGPGWMAGWTESRLEWTGGAGFGDNGRFSTEFSDGN